MGGGGGQISKQGMSGKGSRYQSRTCQVEGQISKQGMSGRGGIYQSRACQVDST